MIAPNLQRSVKPAAEFDASRLSFAAWCWVGLSVLAAIGADIAGAPRWALFWSLALAIAPATATLALASDGFRQSKQMPSLLVGTWTAAAAAAVLATGGTASPLPVLFALAPLAALALDRRRLALEAAVFGVLGAAAAMAASPALAVPTGLEIAANAWSLAALAQAGVFIWAAPWRRVHVEAETPAKADWTASPVMLLRVSAEGRVKVAAGGLHIENAPEPLGRRIDTILGFDPRQRAPGGGRAPLLNAPELEAVWRPEGDEMVAAIVEVERSASADTDAKVAERTSFFAGLGHDLKTPLNAIIGFADIMKAELRGPLSDKYKDYAGLIAESGQDLILLVDDMLDLAKSDAGAHRLDLEPVELSASAASVIRQLEEQAARRGVTLSLSAPGEVWAKADARTVRQIWQNLVSNAVKYSDEGGRVTLAVEAVGGLAAMTVEDRGAGMSQADLDRIAEPFAQGANAKGRSGTGLGLAVVHRFAELHGGRTVIDTAPGKGARVRVTLPLADPSDLRAIEDAAQ
ncbi:MAG: HAMP domain-containing sensor histidine kinase [Pseudomonadota bacterium]